MKFIKPAAIANRLGVKSGTAVRYHVGRGTFTRPVKTSPRSSSWPAHEVDALLQARLAGHSEAQIRELVNLLHHHRAKGSSAEEATAAARDLFAAHAADLGVDQ